MKRLNKSKAIYIFVLFAAILDIVGTFLISYLFLIIFFIKLPYLYSDRNIFKNVKQTEGISKD